MESSVHFFTTCCRIGKQIFFVLPRNWSTNLRNMVPKENSLVIVLKWDKSGGKENSNLDKMSVIEKKISRN